MHYSVTVVALAWGGASGEVPIASVTAIDIDRFDGKIIIWFYQRTPVHTPYPSAYQK
jgi:hypothetical protein